MKHPKPYTGRRVWKTKAGWNAQVYVVAYVRHRPTKAAAVADLDGMIQEMECGDPKCCGTHTVSGSRVFTATVRGS